MSLFHGFLWFLDFGACVVLWPICLFICVFASKNRLEDVGLESKIGLSHIINYIREECVGRVLCV